MLNWLAIAESWLPRIGALRAVPRAVAIYSFQRWADRKNELVKSKRVEYQEFLVNVYTYLMRIGELIEAAKANDQENADTAKERIDSMRDLLAIQQMKLACISSDAVSSKISEFFENVDDIHDSIDKKKEQLRIISRMVLAMRQDCFKGTKLSAAEIEKALPLRVTPAGAPK